MSTDAWVSERRQRMARAKTTPCPNCGARGTIEIDNSAHGGSGGLMLNCHCGARCRVEDWNTGIVTLMRNKDGTYDYVTPDWRPARTAVGLPEGFEQRGSTGQLWRVQGGRWERVHD